MEHIMFDDIFNATFLTLIVATGAAVAAVAFDADAAGTLPTTSIAQAQVVALPTVVVIGRRASMERDRALTSDE
jgi:hypothetical protein